MNSFFKSMGKAAGAGIGCGCVAPVIAIFLLMVLGVFLKAVSDPSPVPATGATENYTTYHPRSRR